MYGAGQCFWPCSLQSSWSPGALCSSMHRVFPHPKLPRKHDQALTNKLPPPHRICTNQWLSYLNSKFGNLWDRKYKANSLSLWTHSFQSLVSVTKFKDKQTNKHPQKTKNQTKTNKQKNPESTSQDHLLIYKDGVLRKRGLNMIQNKCGLKEILKMFHMLNK